MELPETNIKFVVVPDYQNSTRITLKRAIIWTSPYEPQLAHSTGLPKPPGYNLQWSRVIPIRVTLVTGPPAKVSHHVPHLKLCRKLFIVHYHWTKITWRASHAARRNLAPDRLAGITHRQTPRASSTLTVPPPPGGHHHTARLLVSASSPGASIALCQASSPHCHCWLCFASRPPGGSLTPPGATPVAQCYWFLDT